MTTLDDLGPRICILGPSNSGKSTLAAAIGAARGLIPVHLDQLYHHPGTRWVPRPTDAFVALHDSAIDGAGWVMDGNYTLCLPQRLARATGLIVLDVSTATSLLRYLRRCWFETRPHGGLDGVRDRISWNMIRHIAGPTRQNRRRYAVLFEACDRPKLRLVTRAAREAFWRAEGLRR